MGLSLWVPDLRMDARNSKFPIHAPLLAKRALAARGAFMRAETPEEGEAFVSIMELRASKTKVRYQSMRLITCR